jgi:flagellin-specific chaperone FliS
MSPTEMAYRKTAIGGASGFGLLVALYDTLAGDLRRAADAERDCDLGKRTLEVNHAFLVVAYLEDWVNQGSGGELADRLIVFYRTLRAKLMEAQLKRSPEMFEQQMAEVLKIRGIWQGLEHGDSSPAAKTPAWTETPNYASSSPALSERTASSWSA